MTYEFYKTLHLFSLILTFGALFSLLAINFFAEDSKKAITKKLSMAHGIGLLLVVISGFGLTARLGYFSELPGWIYVKLVLWLTVGGIIAVINRKKIGYFTLFFILVLLPVIGSLLAVNKPF